MRNETIAAFAFPTLVAATGPVDALPLFLSILVTYGVMRSLLGSWQRHDGKARAVVIAIVAYAAPLLAFLIALWSFKLDVALPAGGVVWLAVVASLEHVAKVVAGQKAERARICPQLSTVEIPRIAA